MKIVVCVKQVPDTAGEVKFKPDGSLDRAAMLTIMNNDDKAGLEAALRIKDEMKGKEEVEITVVSMGLPKAEDVLREAMAMIHGLHHRHSQALSVIWITTLLSQDVRLSTVIQHR